MTNRLKRQHPAIQIDTVNHIPRIERVILDSDHADIYGVTTKRLNEAVRRNCHRFPCGFIFQHNTREYADLRSQHATSRPHGGRRHRRNAFSEHGAVMAASILNTPRAVQISIFVLHEFIKMRGMFTADKNLTEKLQDLEKRLTRRLDTDERAIVYVLEEIKKLTEPPLLAALKRRPIGFEK